MTQHAAMRTAQRNISANDLELAIRIGTEVHDGILVREKDVQSFVCELKHQINQAQRLVGLRIVNNGHDVITAYRAQRRKLKQLLRR
jgi:hypothetical protein